jgi:hypothetical protein
MQRIFAEKNAPKLLDLKETFYEITLFKQEVPVGCQNIAGFFFKKLVGFYSQIWLIPPVDHQIKKKKKKKILNTGPKIPQNYHLYCQT